MVNLDQLPETVTDEETSEIEWFRQNIPCQQACPAHTDVSNFIGLVAQGRFDEAYRLNRRDNLFPGILGRICARPCEDSCRRSQHDEAMPICALKRSTADFKSDSLLPEMPLVTGTRRVAVVGAGPAGLACARDLREKGYRVTVYDMMSAPGGMLVGGIPAWRLPRELVREEVDRYMDALGVEFQLNTRVGRDISLSTLLGKYDAVFLAAGCQKPAPVALPGEDLTGFEYGLEWLEKVNFDKLKETPEGKRVVVLGAGFTALDCARSAARLGAAKVQVCYRRSRLEAPARVSEILEGEAEGLEFNYLVSPVEVLGGEDGRVTGLRLVRNRLAEPDRDGRRVPQPIPGSEFEIPCDLVISATGQQADTSWVGGLRGLEFGSNGSLSVDQASWMTGVKGLFAGGDFTGGPRNVISAIADGHKAASAIHRYFDGEEAPTSGTVDLIEDWQRNKAYDKLKRLPMPVVEPQRRIGPDPQRNLCLEVESGFGRELAVQQASRCLQCQYNITVSPELCLLCGACTDVCPAGSIRIVPLKELDEEEAGNYPQDPELVGALTITLDESNCMRCGRCLERCPTGAIEMTRVRYSSPAEHWFTGEEGLTASPPR